MEHSTTTTEGLMNLELDEEQRDEVFNALTDRGAELDKLRKKLIEKNIPTDRIDERLNLYRDRDRIVNGEKLLDPGLFALFAREPELSTEALAQQKEREASERGEPNLFGGGAETGGGGGTPNSSVGKWNPQTRKKRGTGPEHIGDIITPPAPREPRGLPAAGTPSNNENVIDPTPTRPTEEGIADLRQAALMTEDDPQREELVAQASHATPSGRVIADPRADARDTVMDGAPTGE